MVQILKDESYLIMRSMEHPTKPKPNSRFSEYLRNEEGVNLTRTLSVRFRMDVLIYLHSRGLCSKLSGSDS